MRISDIFQKLNIKGFDDLKADEKKVYEGWAHAIQKRDVTMEDLKKIFPGKPKDEYASGAYASLSL